MESGCLVKGGGRENRMGGNGREDKSKREEEKPAGSPYLLLSFYGDE